MFRRLVLRCAALALVCFAVSGVAMADTSATVRLVKIPIPGNPLKSFDISWTDPTTGRYYLADRSNKGLDIFDTRTNAFVMRVGGFVGFTGNNDTSGPDGVLLTSHTDAWVGDGNSTVKVVDVHAGTITDTISTGGKARADELAYDPPDSEIIIANDADDPPFLSIISTITHGVMAKITVPDATDGIEQPAFDPNTGWFYVAIPSTESQKGGEIMVIDPKSMKPVTTWALSACEPHGLVIGPGHNMLAGCNLNVHTVVLDDTSGNVVADFAGVGGADEVWFNPGDGRYYTAANARQTMSVIDATTNTWLANLQTGVGAHSVASDMSTNHTFVPIASPDPACPGGCIAVFSSVVSDRGNP